MTGVSEVKIHRVEEMVAELVEVIADDCADRGDGCRCEILVQGVEGDRGVDVGAVVRRGDRAPQRVRKYVLRYSRVEIHRSARRHRIRGADIQHAVVHLLSSSISTPSRIRRSSSQSGPTEPGTSSK